MTRSTVIDHALAWLAVAGIAALTAAVAYGLGEALWAAGWDNWILQENRNDAFDEI